MNIEREVGERQGVPRCRRFVSSFFFADGHWTIPPAFFLRPRSFSRDPSSFSGVSFFPLTSLCTLHFKHNGPLARVRSSIAACPAKGHRWRCVPGSIAEIRQSFGNAVENRRSRKHTPVGSAYTKRPAPFLARVEDSSASLLSLGASSSRSYYTTEAWRGVSFQSIPNAWVSPAMCFNKSHFPGLMLPSSTRMVPRSSFKLLKATIS